MRFEIAYEDPLDAAHPRRATIKKTVSSAVAERPAPVEGSSWEWEEERAAARSRRRRVAFWVAFVLGAIGLALAVAWLIRPTANLLRGWQARQLAGEALTALERGDVTGAAGPALAAYERQAFQEDAMRAVARYLTRAGDFRCLQIWDAMRGRGLLTLEDRRHYFSAALAAGRPALAEALLGEIEEASEPLQPENLLARAGLAEFLDDRSAAEALAAQAARDSRGRPTDTLQAAALLLRSVEVGRREEGTALLLALATGDRGAAGLAALGRLAARSLEESERSTLPAAEVRRLLLAHPVAGAGHRLLADSLRLRLHPGERTAIVSSAVARFGTGPGADRVRLGAWLLTEGEPAQVLKLVSSSEARSDRALGLLFVDALCTLQRWNELQIFLRERAPSLHPSEEEAMQAVAARKLGDETHAKRHWRWAVDLASENALQLVRVGEIAEAAGEWKSAEMAFASAVRVDSGLRAAHAGCLRLARRSGVQARIDVVLEQIEGIWPGARAFDRAVSETAPNGFDPGTRFASGAFQDDASVRIVRALAASTEQLVPAARLSGPPPFAAQSFTR